MPAIPAAARRARGWGFRFGAVVVGLLPFLLIEGTLRFLEVAPTRADPLAGIGGQRPLFERVGEMYRTARTKESLFGQQKFAVRKATNGFRIFCFGGSTVYGHPYLNDTAFPKWLELELAARAPARQVEAINCGGISYASHRLAFVLRETLRYQPDLIILTMGHNEFLEDRTYATLKSHSAARWWLEDKAASLRMVAWLRQQSAARSSPPDSESGAASSPEVDARLDHARAGYASYHRDEVWHGRVVREFKETFRAMLAECRAAHVPVIITTLGSNLRDCPPFKSEHQAGLSAAQEGHWQKCFDDATAADDRDDLPGALAQYREAEAIDARHALLCYRIARCLDRQGQAQAAREYYLRAKDEDICPLRMIDPIYRAQHALATETRTPLVDARTLLEGLCPDGLPGSDLYLDHVHPTIGGHQHIGRALAGKIHELRLLPLARDWTGEERRVACQRHLDSLPSAYFSNGRRRVDWLENWAKRQKLHAETLPRDPFGFLRQGLRQFELGEAEQAHVSFARALQADRRTVPLLAAHVRDLVAQGRLTPDALARLPALTNAAPAAFTR